METRRTATTKRFDCEPVSYTHLDVYKRQLLLGAVYLIFKFAFRMLRSLPEVFTGRASTAVIVGWVLVIVAIISAIISLAGYFKDVK